MTVRELRQQLFLVQNQDAKVFMPDCLPIRAVIEDEDGVYLSDVKQRKPDPYKVTGDPYAIPVLTEKERAARRTLLGLLANSPFEDPTVREAAAAQISAMEAAGQ